MEKNDCGCVGHVGPHWLHQNLVVMQLNLAILERGTSSLSLLAFGREEAVRLADLEDEMRSAGMVSGETIAAYLERSGWPLTVAEAYLRRRDEIKAGTIAVLARIEAETKAQAQHQKQQVMLVAGGGVGRAPQPV